MNEEVDIPFRGQEIRNRAPNLEGIVVAEKPVITIHPMARLHRCHIEALMDHCAVVRNYLEEIEVVIMAREEEIRTELRNRRTILSTLE